MNIENYIETEYRELLSYCSVNTEFIGLYNTVSHSRLREILSTLHYEYATLFKTMNERLPTHDVGAHFWADPSRRLIKTIEITLGLYSALKNDQLAFEIDEYYHEIIMKCCDFLNSSGGSLLPPNMSKIELYYTTPIFKQKDTITITNSQTDVVYALKQIGAGSYADVYQYRDAFYNRIFVIKRAKKDLNAKEISRFKREYDEMDKFSSPYIVEVYNFDQSKNEYIMEYMDYTLDVFIQKNNSTLPAVMRKNIVNQILRAFDYIHSKNRLHRDISPKNILLKEYDDTLVVKISDFGLVKIPDSPLTSVNTEFKGYFNDPALITEGFDTYNILHETYALVRVIHYVLTGRTKTDAISNVKLRSFVGKGLNTDKSKRFQTVAEIIATFRMLD